MHARASRLERWLARVFGDDEPTAVGSGAPQGALGSRESPSRWRRVLDQVFGTQHLPGDAWPETYGIDGDPVPEGYLRQLAHPFVPHDDRRGGVGLR